MVVINRSLNDYVHLREEAELLRMDLLFSDSVIYIKDSVINKQEQIITHKDSLIKVFDKKHKSDIQSKDYQIRTLKRKNKKTVLGVGTVGTLLGLIIGVLLRK